MSMQTFEAEKVQAAQDIIDRFSLTPDGLDHLKKVGFQVMSGSSMKAFPVGWEYNTGNLRQVLETWSWNGEEWEKKVSPTATLHFWYWNTSEYDQHVIIEDLKKGAIVVQVASQHATAIYPTVAYARWAANSARGISDECRMYINGQPV